MSAAYVVAARRTAVAPRNGAFRNVEAHELAAPVMQALLRDSSVGRDAVDRVILGNALYGGGNPARVAALAAGLPASVAAMSIDTQCCAGLDAVAIGASLIESGQARIVIAGGVESYSRAPVRATRPRAPGEAPVPYERPPFTPWPDADPDMIEAAALLASDMQTLRRDQEAYAIASHRKSIAAQADLAREIVPVAAQINDAFVRALTETTCRRLPVLQGEATTGVTAATVAVEADAAAALLLVDEETMQAIACGMRPVRIAGVSAGAGDPRQPALAAIEPAKALLARAGFVSSDLAVVEIMEAFAIQAMAFNHALDIPAEKINRGGGALSRGHPIGASGAILAVRLFRELQKDVSGSCGLAAIAAAGGLGSALLLNVL